MGKVIIDLFLPDPQGHGQVTSAMLLTGKQDYHLLPYGPHARSVFRVSFHLGANPLLKIEVVWISFDQSLFRIAG